MPKVMFSGVGITAMNGSWGDESVTRNFYGPYIRKKRGTPAISANLAAWHTIFQGVHAAWELGLTDADRKAWIDAAATENVKQILKATMGNVERRRVLTGFHYFMEANLNVSLAGGAGLVLPPTLVSLATLLSVTITSLTSTTFTISWVSQGILTNWQAIIYCSAEMNPGRMSNNQIFMNTDNSFALSAGSANIHAAYVLRFGAGPTVGRKIFVRLDCINSVTGQRYRGVYDSAIVL